MRRRAAFLFAAIGLVLYLALYAAAEALLLRHGDANPFYRMRNLPAAASADWLVLGASHAMPLDFGGSGAAMQRATGLAIVNLGATGTGPLYNRFVLERFLRQRRAANVLYVADAFAFHSAQWNEERFADAKLLARTPWDLELAVALGGYVRDEGVSWRAWLAYTSGFAKINNADRFQRDAWEGEAQFENAWRPSASAVKKRVGYLYPDGTPEAARARYLAQLQRLVATGREAGARVVVVKPPVPASYRAQLPDEAAFDAALAQASAAAGATFLDWSTALPEPRWYFDSDHLNRAGVQALFDSRLRALLQEASRAGA